MPDRRRIIRDSQSQERRTAQSLGARQHAGSGNGWVHKNDSRTDRLLIENKMVMKGRKQITIKDVDLEDLRRNAARKGREPVLSFELGGKDFAIVEWDYVLQAEDLHQGESGSG